MVTSASRIAYTVLVGAVAVQRLVELAVSKRNLERALERGAEEAGRDHFRWMVTLHVTFLAACLVETWGLRRPWVPALGASMLAVLVAATALRYWVITTLGVRWTTRVVYVPGDPLVTGGPFRWVRHPNYLAVAAEMAALPLVHTAWITAAVYSIANALLLRERIAVEEDLLRRVARPPGGGPR